MFTCIIKACLYMICCYRNRLSSTIYVKEPNNNVIILFLQLQSNFSSVLEPERAYPLIQSPSHNILNDTTFDRKRNYNMGKISTTQDDVVRVCGTEIDAKSASNSRHTPRKHTKGRLSGQKVESIKVCQVKTAAVRTDYDAESLTKLCQSTVQDLNRDCYACCYHKKINQSQSDSFLQFKYHNHSREPFNPHPSNIYKEQAMSVETSPAKDVTLAADSKQLNDDLDMPSLGEVSLASVDEQKKKADTLQRKGSISSVISNDVIILLTSSSLHNEQTESTKYLSLQDSNDIPILTHEEQIMRQIAYLNLPTHDITTSSPRIPESNFNMVISKVCKDGDQNHMCGEIIDSRASFGFNSITELSQKLTQIASSMSNQLLCQQSVPHDQVETSQAIVLYPMNNVLGDLNFPGTNDCKSTVTETNKTATVAETNKTASDFAPCSITKLTKSNSTGTCNDVVSDDTASELVSSTSHLTLCSSTSLPHNHTEATSPCTTVTITHTSSSEATPPCTVTTYTSDATTSHTSSSEASPPCTVTTYTDRDATTTHTSSSQVDDGDAKNMIIVSTQNEMQNEPRIRGSLVINDECITHVTSPINVRTECNATRMTSSSYYDSATTHADGFNMNYSDRGSQVMIDGASFLCQSCSRNLSSAEAQRHISRMLTLVISPLQLAAAVSMEPAVTNGDDEKHTSTCLTATWE